MVKNKKTIKKKCDVAFSLAIRKHGRCQLAGLDKVHCSTTLQCMHIETRGSLRLRYDQQNALCGCSGHHWYYTNNPSKFNDLVAEFFPSQWEYVQKHKEERLNMTYEDYEELLKGLRS